MWTEIIFKRHISILPPEDDEVLLGEFSNIAKVLLNRRVCEFISTFFLWALTIFSKSLIFCWCCSILNQCSTAWNKNSIIFKHYIWKTQNDVWCISTMYNFHSYTFSFVNVINLAHLSCKRHFELITTNFRYIEC